MCERPDEYIISPFLANNISVPTRYVAPPYHFQLDERGVRAGLVENLNTMHEMGNGEREISRSKGEWVAKKINKCERREVRQMGRKGMGSAICICLISFT